MTGRPWRWVVAGTAAAPMRDIVSGWTNSGDGLIFFGGGTDHAVKAWHRVRELVREHSRPAEGFGGEYVLLPWGGIGELTAEIDAWQRPAGHTYPS